MAVRDDTMEVSVSSHKLDYVEGNQSRDLLFLEDFSWADSCLIKDPEISYTNWSSLKDALLEIQNSQPGSLDNFSSRRDGFPGETDTEILPSSEEANTSQNLRGRIDDILRNEDAEMENDNDSYIILRKTDILRSRTNLVNNFMSNYNDNIKGTANTVSGLDLGFPGVLMEQSTEDIFRVWDLDISAEEDVLIRQLNEALADSSVQPLPSTFDDSGVCKDLEEKSFDDLISDIAGLSLSQNSSLRTS